MVEGDEDEDEEKDQTVLRVSNTVTGHLREVKVPRLQIYAL